MLALCPSWNLPLELEPYLVPVPKVWCAYSFSNLKACCVLSYESDTSSVLKGLTVRLEIKILIHFSTDEKTEVTEKLCLAQGYTAK